jgi:hypothetical protein
VLQLRPYQQRWIDDPSRGCFAVKSARIGFSYATGLRRLLKKGGLLERENKTCTVLSASKAQSNEFVETVQKNIQLIGATAQLFEEPFADIDGVTSFTQSRIQLPNGSRYIALPANPRTARGYPGDAVLDEFGHHDDSYAIWAAIIRQIALGNEIDVLSTPNGEQGKYFDLAKDLGLTDGVAPSPNPKKIGIWSAHWVDVYLAVKEGCPINIEEMRELIKDDETFSQEFLCAFLKDRGFRWSCLLRPKTMPRLGTGLKVTYRAALSISVSMLDVKVIAPLPGWMSKWATLPGRAWLCRCMAFPSSRPMESRS